MLTAQRDAVPRTKHGEASAHGRAKPSKEYRAWQQMRDRCRNPNPHAYADYGGRGIRVCQQWDDFSAFLRDLGRAPSPQHSLDRYPDPNGNYEPGNVRWASQQEQVRNRRDTRFIIYKGRRMALTDAADRAGLPYQALLQRMKKGWPRERLFEPLRERATQRQKPEPDGRTTRTNTPMVTYQGRRMPLAEAAARAGIKYVTAYQRYTRGWPEDRLFEAPTHRRSRAEWVRSS